MKKALVTSLILFVSATLSGCAVYVPPRSTAYVGPSYAYVAPAPNVCIDSFGYSYRC